MIGRLLFAYNHPSGVMEVTTADIDMTKNIGMIAKLLDIN